ncbi:MAG: hypothetical protein ACYCSW_07430 [bacterium]
MPYHFNPSIEIYFIDDRFALVSKDTRESSEDRNACCFCSRGYRPRVKRSSSIACH